MKSCFFFPKREKIICLGKKIELGRVQKEILFSMVSGVRVHCIINFFMAFFNISALEEKEVIDGYRGRAIHTGTMTLCIGR